MLFNMLECSNALKKYDLNIVYNGALWADGVEGLASTIKQRMVLDALPTSVSHTVFSVFIEQVNNMLMYSTENEPHSVAQGAPPINIPQGSFAMGTKLDSYYLMSGNMMRIEDVSVIKEQIDYLNTLDKKELRKYYKEMMRKENDNPNSKGAGLGLIEIARRASSKIQCEFTPVNDESTYFTMYVEVIFS